MNPLSRLRPPYRTRPPGGSVHPSERARGARRVRRFLGRGHPPPGRIGATFVRAGASILADPAPAGATPAAMPLLPAVTLASRPAARAGDAEPFIFRLPRGYDTDVRERGAILWAGERRLLSFACAHAFDPRIPTLEEATPSGEPPARPAEAGPEEARP